MHGDLGGGNTQETEFPTPLQSCEMKLAHSTELTPPSSLAGRKWDIPKNTQLVRKKSSPRDGDDEEEVDGKQGECTA